MFTRYEDPVTHETFRASTGEHAAARVFGGRPGDYLATRHPANKWAGAHLAVTSADGQQYLGDIFEQDSRPLPVTPEDRFRDIVTMTHADGGATFYRDGRPVTFDPLRRYVVGGVDGYRLSIPATSLRALDIRTVVAANGEHGTFGTWIDPDTDMVDAEPVDIFSDRDTALTFARERGEKAIWDAVEGQEVWVQPQRRQCDHVI